MPSGITHILLTRYFNDRNKNRNLHMLLAAGRDFFQVGSVAPDLPYSSIADSDILHSETDLADNFHYRKTNQVPLQAINYLKTNKHKYTGKEERFILSFFLGYAAHVIADGLIHPFIRDMVGDYEQNKFKHRQLEMRLDVLFYNFYTKSSGGQEFNYSNLHDELINLEDYPETKVVLELFNRHIKSIYNKEFDDEKILGWVNGLHTLLDIAEGDHPSWYSNIQIIGEQLYSNYDALEERKNDFIILEKPVDRVPDNFLHNDKINFFKDCVPKFVSTFGSLAKRAYECVYEDGDDLSEEDIPPIDLDTGRPLGKRNNLELIPTLWS